MIFSFIS